MSFNLALYNTDKRKRHQDRISPEHWLIDPQEEAVIVFDLNADPYVKVRQFQGRYLHHLAYDSRIDADG